MDWFVSVMAKALDRPLYRSSPNAHRVVIRVICAIADTGILDVNASARMGRADQLAERPPAPTSLKVAHEGRRASQLWPVNLGTRYPNPTRVLERTSR